MSPEKQLSMRPVGVTSNKDMVACSMVANTRLCMVLLAMRARTASMPPYNVRPCVCACVVAVEMRVYVYAYVGVLVVYGAARHEGQTRHSSALTGMYGVCVRETGEGGVGTSVRSGAILTLTLMLTFCL